MILVLIIVGIALISALISYVSVVKEKNKQHHVEQLHQELSKSRVIFYSNTPKQTTEVS